MPKGNSITEKDVASILDASGLSVRSVHFDENMEANGRRTALVRLEPPELPWLEVRHLWDFCGEGRAAGDDTLLDDITTDSINLSWRCPVLNEGPDVDEAQASVSWISGTARMVTTIGVYDSRLLLHLLLRPFFISYITGSSATPGVWACWA